MTEAMTAERYGGLVVENVRRPQTHIERVMLRMGEAPSDYHYDLPQWIVEITDNCWDVD